MVYKYGKITRIIHEFIGLQRDTPKQWMGQGAFLTRRLDNIRGEFSLTALHDFLTMYTYWDCPVSMDLRLS